MSDVYCRACDDDIDFGSPACLANITPKRGKPKHRNLLTIESELELPNVKEPKKERKIAVKEKNNENRKNVKENRLNGNGKNNNKKVEEYELAQLATAFDDDLPVDIVKMGVLNDFDSKLMIRVQGKEELPATQTTNTNTVTIGLNNVNLNKYSSVDNCSTHPLDSNRFIDNNVSIDNTNTSNTRRIKSERQKTKNELSIDDYNGNDGRFNRMNRAYSTFPKMKNKQNVPNLRPLRKVPMRTTPDGTNIYYWCDVPKKTIKG